VREVEHAHHAEDERQPRAEQEQQQPVADAVQHRDGEEFHPVALLDLEMEEARIARDRASAEVGVAPQEEGGRFMSHEVGVLDTYGS
jgi:hypothetical protein